MRDDLDAPPYGLFAKIGGALASLGCFLLLWLGAVLFMSLDRLFL